MAGNPEPIQQRIEADYRDAGFKAAARDIKALGEASAASGNQAEQASRKTRTREQRLADIKEELNQLTRVEGRHEQRVKRAGRADERATRTTRTRQARIEKLSRALAVNQKRQDRVTASVKRASAAQGEMAGASRLASVGMASLAKGFVGGLGVSALIGEFNDRLEASNRLLEINAGLTRENAEARLDLAALSGVETPESVAFIDKAAAFSGRRPGEIARTQTQIKSGLPTATQAEVEELVIEIASAGQITKSPLPAITPAFLDIFRRTGDAKLSGNLLQGAIRGAGEPDPAKLGQEISKFVGVGQQIGGLDVPTAIGFAAAGTGLGLPNEIATTGLKNVTFSLLGKGTPEGVKVLDREGIPRDDLVEGIKAIQVAVEEGRISNAELEAIGGREAAPVFAALSDRETLTRFLDSVQIVVDAGKSEGRLSEQKAKGITESSESQRLNLLAKQVESETESIKSGDTLSLERHVAQLVLEREVAALVVENKISPARAEAIISRAKKNIAGGGDPAFAAGFATAAQPGIIGFVNDFRFVDQVQSAVREAIEQGPVTEVDQAFPSSQPTTVIDNRTIINGTQVNQGRDPRTGDLAEGRPRN